MDDGFVLTFCLNHLKPCEAEGSIFDSLFDQLSERCSWCILLACVSWRMPVGQHKCITRDLISHVFEA